MPQSDRAVELVCPTPAHARSAQDCVLVSFEQLQDNLPGQLGPFPCHSPSNKLRGCFWTEVLDLGFFHYAT